MRRRGRSLIALIGLHLAVLASTAPAQAQESRFDPTTGPVLIGEISDKLKEFGFYAGPRVTDVTPALADAIIAYRQQAGLPAGAYADQELVNRLNFGPAVQKRSPDARLIASPIREAQMRLQALGFYTATIDGRDGPATQEAVRQFQAQHDMALDGKVTPALIKKLGEKE